MNSTLNIRLATLNDLDDINILFGEVVKDLDTIKKINMWNAVYPFCEFEKDIKNQGMQLIVKENKIIGSFNLTEYDDPENHEINWAANSAKGLYINRLVILPSEQGKGYAKFAMKYIGEYALENKYEVVRLTVYKDNQYAIGLYETFGFVKIENSHLVIDEKVFIGYEKMVR